MRAVDTPIGKVVVLSVPCGVRCNGGCGECPSVPAIGDTVDVEEDCPHDCQRFGGKVPGLARGSNWDWVPCWCGGSGTVSVPHVVTEVLPIVDEDRWHELNPPLPCLVVTWAGPVMYVPLTLSRHAHSVDLPDAQPGGVVLVVERAP